jgi:hypothetical protein
MFYTFNQNNSGGSFVRDESVCEYVVIEAESAEHANTLAQEKAGIYFDGVRNGSDCGCCGDRWWKQWDDEDGTEVPSVYGKPLTETQKGAYRTEAIVYYLDGRKEVVKFPE